MSATDWTSEEEAVARQAFDLGKQRSIVTLIDNLKDLSTKLDTPESIWQFHDYLSTERYQYEGRMEFDSSNTVHLGRHDQAEADQLRRPEWSQSTETE